MMSIVGVLSAAIMPMHAGLCAVHVTRSSCLSLLPQARLRLDTMARAAPYACLMQHFLSESAQYTVCMPPLSCVSHAWSLSITETVSLIVRNLRVCGGASSIYYVRQPGQRLC
jgi:hypothetical protein